MPATWEEKARELGDLYKALAHLDPEPLQREIGYATHVLEDGVVREHDFIEACLTYHRESGEGVCKPQLTDLEAFQDIQKIIEGNGLASTDIPALEAKCHAAAKELGQIHMKKGYRTAPLLDLTIQAREEPTMTIAKAIQALREMEPVEVKDFDDDEIGMTPDEFEAMIESLESGVCASHRSPDWYARELDKLSREEEELLRYAETKESLSKRIESCEKHLQANQQLAELEMLIQDPELGPTTADMSKGCRRYIQSPSYRRRVRERISAKTLSRLPALADRWGPLLQLSALPSQPFSVLPVSSLEREYEMLRSVMDLSKLENEWWDPDLVIAPGREPMPILE